MTQGPEATLIILILLGFCYGGALHLLRDRVVAWATKMEWEHATTVVTIAMLIPAFVLFFSGVYVVLVS